MSTFTSLPYSKGHGRVMGDMMKNGSPWNYCLRGFIEENDPKNLNGYEIKGSLKTNFTF